MNKIFETTAHKLENYKCTHGLRKFVILKSFVNFLLNFHNDKNMLT